MNQNKLVSVTINAYNSEKFIAETLNSVINQTYKNLQIIVVNDASTDATAEIVKGFDDPRIELYTLQNNGHISNANNECYHKVRGEYMVHTDADDVLNPDLIEKTVGYLEAHPECGAVFCRLSTIDENSNEVEDSYVDNVFKVTAKTQADFVRLFFDQLNHLSHTGATLRKSVIDDIGFHDLSLCYLHDFDYWTRLVLKYSIHVIDECLAKYRRIYNDTEHNSSLNEEKMVAHNTEFIRIIYRMIEDCSDDLFLEAFSDRLILKGEHTPEEIKLEKAFLLQDGLSAIHSPKNKILSISMLSKLFEDKKYVELARDKFGFTIRDFYKLQTTPAFYDENESKELRKIVSNLEDKEQYLTSHIEELRADIAKKGEDLSYYIDLVNHKQNEIEAKENVVQAMRAELDAKEEIVQQKQAEIETKDNVIDQKESIIQQKQSEIDAKEEIVQFKQTEIDTKEEIICQFRNEIENLNLIIAHKQKLLNKTLLYTVIRIVKKILSLLKTIKSFYSKRGKSGKKYRKSVMLYGYYAINLGDDLFFEKLVSRYPDAMFLVYSVYFCKEYREFFEKFDNVKFYSTDDELVQKINRIGDKFKIKDLFELLLLKRSKATVHIGGSIYQEVNDYKLDYKIRKRRKQCFKPFYSLSCNFGAYKTQEFKNMWIRQFKKFKDICFRDKYSYEQFVSMKNVRYAPDVLFSYKAQTEAQVDGSVAISVINPFATGRGISEQVGNAYLDALVKTVEDLVSCGKAVTLLGFCAFEGDGVFLHDLLCRLPDGMREKIVAMNYTIDTKQQVLNAIETAEYVIGTRLHSVVLGLAYGKKVLPISYNTKMDYILDDIGYDQTIIKLEQVTEYTNTGFASLLDGINHFDASKFANSDDLQFAKLDQFLN